MGESPLLGRLSKFPPSSMRQNDASPSNQSRSASDLLRLWAKRTNGSKDLLLVLVRVQKETPKAVEPKVIFLIGPEPDPRVLVNVPHAKGS